MVSPSDLSFNEFYAVIHDPADGGGIQIGRVGVFLGPADHTLGRIYMTRYIKRGGKVWIKIFPDKPVTAKPAETRMGSGKGALEYWVAVVKPGRVLFEIAGVPEELAREALRLAMHKLPCKCKIAAKADLEGGE